VTILLDWENKCNERQPDRHERNDLPGYDKFRTGLSYRDIWEMMRDDSEESSRWRYKRRGTVLVMWHELKLQMYHQAIDMGYSGK
jgi:hypothetical protein